MVVGHKFSVPKRVPTLGLSPAALRSCISFAGPFTVPSYDLVHYAVLWSLV